MCHVGRSAFIIPYSNCCDIVVVCQNSASQVGLVEPYKVHRTADGSLVPNQVGGGPGCGAWQGRGRGRGRGRDATMG